MSRTRRSQLPGGSSSEEGRSQGSTSALTGRTKLSDFRVPARPPRWVPLRLLLFLEVVPVRLQEYTRGRGRLTETRITIGSPGVCAELKVGRGSPYQAAGTVTPVKSLLWLTLSLADYEAELFLPAVSMAGNIPLRWQRKDGVGI